MKILIDTDWFSAIQDLQPSKQKEVLMAILNYPNGDSDTNLWKKTILPNLEKGKISYFNKLQNLKQNNPQKTGKKITDSVTDSDIGSDTEPNTDTTIREDKDKNNSKSKFYIDSIIYVNGQYFDEFPVEALSLLKKYWSDDELENMRKELACKPEHQTTVEKLLQLYPPLQKQAEEHFERFWSSYTPVKTTDGRVVSKGSRKETQAKYMKIIKSGVNPVDILNGLNAYINDCQKNNRFTCGATVFLNQERWKDDYTPVTAVAQQSISQMPRMSLKEMKEMQNELEIQKILRGER